MAAKEGTITLMVLTNVKDSPAITMGDAEMQPLEALSKGLVSTAEMICNQKGIRERNFTSFFL